MGTKYPGVSISGYNSSPPSDDGSATEANKTKWSTIKTKITDPIKTLAESINTALATAFDYSAISKTANYTVTAAEHMKTIECDGTFTVTLGAAASMGAGYIVRIKNIGSGTITVDGNGSETIDDDTTITLAPNDSVILAVDSGAGGYLIVADRIQKISDVTATAAELNILDGVTATAAELNILDGVTSTTAELNILDGVTATAAELNILDGVTSNATELNLLDGITTLSGSNTGDEAPASTTTAGVIEIATDAEINTGTDTSRAITPAGLRDNAIISGTTTDTSTGSTSYDLSTSIPSWAKKITITFANLDSSGSSQHLIQLGDSGGFETTGYSGAGGVGASYASSTAGFIIYHNAAGMTMSGSITLTLLDSSTNLWVASGAFGRVDAAQAGYTGGDKALSGTLDRVRLTTVNGTDTFNDGLVSLVYS